MTDTRTNKEISVAIAKILWPCFCGANACDRISYREPYAEDHNAAHLVVDAMRERGYTTFACGYYSQGMAWAQFSKKPESYYRLAPSNELPRAICLAAEAALGAEVLPPIRKMGDPGYRFAYTPEIEEEQG